MPTGPYNTSTTRPSRSTWARNPQLVGRAKSLVAGEEDDYKVVYPWDLVELNKAGAAPVIRNRIFRHVQLTGPAVIAFSGKTDLIRVTFGALNLDPDSVTWEWGDPDTRKIGAYLFEDCIFEDCRTESIGFTGDPKMVETIRRVIQETPR
jgi:hypothetical protein